MINIHPTPHHHHSNCFFWNPFTDLQPSPSYYTPPSSRDDNISIMEKSASPVTTLPHLPPETLLNQPLHLHRFIGNPSMTYHYLFPNLLLPLSPERRYFGNKKCLPHTPSSPFLASHLFFFNWIKYQNLRNVIIKLWKCYFFSIFQSINILKMFFSTFHNIKI